MIIMELKNNGITTDTDLRQMLNTCYRCYKLTNNGKLVMSYTDLINVNKLHCRRKCVIILNTIPKSVTQNNPVEVPNMSQSTQQTTGHWFCCVLYESTLYVFDGLGKIHQNTDVMHNIRQFCQSNNFTFENVHFRFQILDKFHCGYLALFFVAKTSLLNQRSFLKMINMLKQHNVKSREKHMLKYVLRHFKINL